LKTLVLSSLYIASGGIKASQLPNHEKNHGGVGGNHSRDGDRGMQVV